MKALIATAYGDVENLTLAEMPEPKVGPDDVKVRVHAASINAHDWKLLSGYGRGTPAELHFPAILGHGSRSLRAYFEELAAASRSADSS